SVMVAPREFALIRAYEREGNVNQRGKNAVIESASKTRRVGDKPTRSRSFRRMRPVKTFRRVGNRHCSSRVAGCGLRFGLRNHVLGRLQPVDSVAISACAWLCGSTRDSESVRGWNDSVRGPAAYVTSGARFVQSTHNLEDACGHLNGVDCVD